MNKVNEAPQQEEQKQTYGEIPDFLMLELAEAAKQKKALEVKIKELKQIIEPYVQANPGLYPKGEKTEVKFGCVKWVATNEVVLPKDFDIVKFYKKNPQLVKSFSFDIAKLKAAIENENKAVTMFGIEVKSNHKLNLGN